MPRDDPSMPGSEKDQALLVQGSPLLDLHSFGVDQERRDEVASFFLDEMEKGKERRREKLQEVQR